MQRHGPDQAVYCALGKSLDGYDIFCPRPVLNGGWPAPFAFDRPGISVEDRIGFPEDDFRPWPFVADVAFFVVILEALRRVTRRLRRLVRIDDQPHRRRMSRHPRGGGDR